MDWTLAASSIIISLGAVIMLINIVSYKLTIKAANKTSEDETRHTEALVKAHMFFMVFFFLAYLGILYLFLNKIEFASSFFVAIIFLFGAIFVFMGIVIQKRIFSALNKTNLTLQDYNKRLEDEQERLLDANNKLQIEIEHRVKAEEADQMKSDFLSLVSHELRTPLTSIYGFTKLVGKGLSGLDSTQDTKTYNQTRTRLENNLDIVCDECSRLTRLINNVLDLAKIESGQVNWNDTPTSLHDLINTTAAAVEGLFVEKRSVLFVIDVPNTLPSITVDKDFFCQVLINLVSNALKFTDKGTVTLSVKTEDNGIQIAVTDTGEGIHPDHLQDIFDKFYIVRRGDTLGGKQSGTGLGLPICKQTVEHYGGKIWVESELEKGSTFYVFLPGSIIQMN